jgi:O-Antigen ligase
MKEIPNSILKMPSLGSKKIQKTLNWIAFFVAFPVIDVLGNSIYFYFLMALFYFTYKHKGYLFKKSKFNIILIFLLGSGIISSIFHPVLEFDPGLFGKVNIVLHFAYWFAIGAYFSTWLVEINFYLLAKYITIGLLVHIFTFYFVPIKFDFFVVGMKTVVGRNSLVFDVLAFSGFVLYYLFFKYGRTGVVLGGLFLFLSLVGSGGRAGSVIGLFLVLLCISLFSQSIGVGIRLLMFFTFFGFIILSSNNQTIYSITTPFATYFESINPRLATLLKGEGEGDLDKDKSWLIRKLMVDKSFEIIGKNPVFGIGFGNFTKFGADLEEVQTAEYRRLKHLDSDFLNTRSAHNSYAAFIAETGILGFCILLFILLPNVIYAFRTFFFTLNTKIMFFVVISFIAILVHMYVISSFTGTNFWLMIGIVEGIRNYKTTS